MTMQPCNNLQTLQTQGYYFWHVEDTLSIIKKKKKEHLNLTDKVEKCYQSSHLTLHARVIKCISPKCSFNAIILRPGKTFPSMSVFLLTVNADHVLQDQDPLGQDLQGLPELLHGFTLNNTTMFM